jgi:putative ABC transport system substrate-binding protein
VVVVAGGTGTALAAKAATATIPIVFAVGGDPVRVGLVDSLSRPGGNATGIAQFSDLLVTKRLEVVHELVPRAATIAVLLNPTNPNVQFRLADVQATASTLGREIRILNASGEQQFDAVFASVVQERIGAIVVQDDPLFTNNGERLVALAARHAVPTIYQLREFVAAGGLISYGPHVADAYRQVGLYVARILKGEKPASLHVLQPTKFELVINLRTAKALGITIPPALLARADEVIE